MRRHRQLRLLAGVAIACGCSSEKTTPSDSGTTDATADVGSDVSMPMFDAGDAGSEASIPDCGTPNFADAGTCATIPICSSDPPPDMQAIAKCQMSSAGACGPLYKLVVECTRKYTICNPYTCKTDPVKTGTSLQQNCASQQMNYDNCVSD